jgi:hypothetical protein
MNGKEIYFISSLLRLVLAEVLGLDEDFTDKNSGSKKGNDATYPLHDISFRFLKCMELGSSRDSSARIATGYRLDGRSSNPSRDTIFLFSTSSRPVLGPTQPPNQWVRGSFLGSKAAGA